MEKSSKKNDKPPFFIILMIIFLLFFISIIFIFSSILSLKDENKVLSAQISSLNEKIENIKTLEDFTLPLINSTTGKVPIIDIIIDDLVERDKLDLRQGE